MRCTATVIIFCLAVFTAAPSTAQPDEASVRRFAMVIGANDGGPDRVRLRYAGDDALAFAAVMSEMGALSAGDTVVLVDPDRRGIEEAFRDLGGHLGATGREGQRTEFFFYYSGHSDEQGLLVSDGRLDYRDVRTMVEDLGADVRIGIFDSCASGAFTRIKGGERVAPLLIDESSDVRGHAYLTSSSADEAAQESDVIEASFFTHYFVSGLRGAADMSGDRRVTLNEAYRFAFDETLARTESTLGGPQHPTYDIRMVGTGDVVLTDLNVISATLTLSDSLHGRFFIRDAQGALVAELFKPAGRQVELGLAPGHYDIRFDSEDGLFAAEVELVEDSTTVLDADQLVAQAQDVTTPRGEGSAGAEEPAAETVVVDEGIAAGADGETYRHLPVAMALVTPIDSNSVEAELPVLNNFAFNWIYGQSDRVDGVQLGLVANYTSDRVRGVQAAGAVNVVGGPLYGVALSGLANVGLDEITGVQGTGAVNVNLGRVTGVQAAGGGNYAGEVDGFQGAGGVNVSVGLVRGVQMAGGGNYAGEVNGLQAAPVNIAQEVEGAQIGPVNVASGRVSGVQIGVVNWADEADASIGLIGATRAGGFHPEVWTSDTSVTTLGLRTDANWTYTFLSAGIYPNDDDTAYLFGAGLGVKFPRFVPQFGLDFDVSHHAVMFDNDFDAGYTGLSIARLLARWQVIPELAIFAGPSLNVYVGQDENRFRQRPGYIDTVETYQEENDTQVEIWPGFAAGISLL